MYCSESVPINYAGIFLYFFYPGAFVNFSDQYFNKCSLIKKLRILCAGVWHNVIIFLFGIFILNSGIITLSMSLTGYKSVVGTGVSVIGVEVSTIY
jgi:S2P endopeptidase